MKSKLNIQDEVILLLAQSKMWSEQSTYLQGELAKEDKQAFTRALAGIDSFVNHFEGKVPIDKRDVYKLELEGITDALHVGMTGLRNDLINKQ